MVEVIEVKTRKQRKEFVEYPLRIYQGNEYFVPPLYGEEMAMFTDKNIYTKTCKSAFFLAVRDGVTVGRIQGIIQNQFNELKGTRQARFTRFDCEENAETAKALFAAVENWAKSEGMNEIVGPLGYSDMEREGLLIEGFEYLATFEEQYNYPYYAGLIEGCGYEKDIDWLEWRLFSLKVDDERFQRLFDRAMKKYNLHIAGEKLGKAAFIKKYAKGIFRCIDECYGHLYGVVPYTPEMQKQMIDQFMLILSRKYIVAIADENDEVVAFGLCLPGIGKALQKSGGRLTPAGLVRLLKAVKKPETVDFALVGILPKYRNSGLSVFMMLILRDMFADPNLKYMETNLCLETNYNIQAVWKHFENIQHKRRRSYKKQLD
ncbi:MAG: N-acetyltransferase [Clostridia bacterium]|nr:N-acetyltransferase [Clostridia bacterium]